MTQYAAPLHDKQYKMGASLHVMKHLKQELAEPQANRTLKP